MSTETRRARRQSREDLLGYSYVGSKKKWWEGKGCFRFFHLAIARGSDHVWTRGKETYQSSSETLLVWLITGQLVNKLRQLPATSILIDHDPLIQALQEQYSTYGHPLTHPKYAYLKAFFLAHPLLIST